MDEEKHSHHFIGNGEVAAALRSCMWWGMAWRRWCSAAWKEFAAAAVVTSWYENSCDSWLLCTLFGRTTVPLKTHAGLILYILSVPPARTIQWRKDKKLKKLLVKCIIIHFMWDTGVYRIRGSSEGSILWNHIRCMLVGEKKIENTTEIESFQMSRVPLVIYLMKLDSP